MAAILPPLPEFVVKGGVKTREYLGWYNKPIYQFAAAAIVAVTPFNQEDWPNPPPKPRVEQPVLAQNLLLTTLAVQVPVAAVQAPFAQEDWPNPAKPWQRDLTWTQTPEVIPQVPTTDAFGTPFYQTEYPNPQVSADSKVSLLWFNSAILPRTDQTQGAFGTPFYQTNWPNPSFPNVGWRDYSWSQSPAVQQTVTALVQQPFYQTDWANPLKPYSRDGTWFNTPEIIPQVPDVASAVPPAFNQLDWQNPSFAKQVWRDLTWTQGPAVPQTAAATTQTPFSQTEWALTSRAKWVDGTWSQNLLESTLSPISEVVGAFGTPFYQTEFPNPLRSLDSSLSLLWFNSAILPKTDQATPVLPASAVPPAFFQTDWPNPVLRVSFRDLTWTQSPTTITPSGAEAAPFQSVVFREALVSPPVRRIREREWGWIQSANPGVIPTALPPAPPFYQTEHPNPILRASWRDHTWVETPFTGNIVPTATPPSPFYQTQHPNPVLRTPFKESGWVRFANIGDIPVVIPVVPVPPAPVDDVKPSGGRVDHEFRYAIEGRKTYVQKLRDWRIAQEAAEIIERVALQQAATLEIDEAKNARELKRALRLAKVEDDARYLELLAERRELAKNEEIGALLYKTVQDEEDILALLMIAAQLL